MIHALIPFDLPDADLVRLTQHFPQVEWVRCTERDKSSHIYRKLKSC